jgi:hypothetical protein
MTECGSHVLFMCPESKADRDEERWDTVGGRNAMVAGQEMGKRKLNGQEREENVLPSPESEDRERESLLVGEG